MEFEGKSLSYAVLHGPIHHPDTGEIRRVLTAKGDGLNKAVKMTLFGDKVLVEVPFAKNSKKFAKLVIPLTGFTHTVLADE